ncbi:hypothetical protein M8C21_018066 [Ambrosia artemisiifolia]|uniref:Uncharacterized protein n=1 Tax=Ambrosia artemisiifolia TaxID=4212 RepID=A0AAD5BRC7_AMBAR|nr:hypothetical protein M8C21_018066 [Ambrosia artemisiifolia]
MSSTCSSLCYIISTLWAFRSIDTLNATPIILKTCISKSIKGYWCISLQIPPNGEKTAMVLENFSMLTLPNAAS